MGTIKLIITKARGNITASDQCGHTPLQYLFKNKTVSKKDIQWIFTEDKGDLNVCEQNKSTPLHHLCANSGLQLDIVDVLISEGKGDFNKGDEFGTTPFHHLCENREVDLDVVYRIVDTAKGDINKQDENGITPLHVLCKGTLRLDSLLPLINRGNKGDRYGNTTFLGGVDSRQLKQILETDMKKQNILGYTPIDYLTGQDGSLPWTDGMIERSAADIVMCRFNQGDNQIIVLGPTMSLSSERVHEHLQVEYFGREMTNMTRSRIRRNPDQFSTFWGTCSKPFPILPSHLSNASYFETNFSLTCREIGTFHLLEMGMVDDLANFEAEGKRYISNCSRSVCLSVQSTCPKHPDSLCIKSWSKGRQIGECITLPRPTSNEVCNFFFGLVVDARRGRIAFVDVEGAKVLCKVDLNFPQELLPVFYVHLNRDNWITRMRLISGREIAVNDRKKELIKQALSKKSD